MLKHLTKIRGGSKTNNIGYRYTTYYGPFHHYKSNKENTIDKDEDLIKILKEIEYRENSAILIK